MLSIIQKLELFQGILTGKLRGLVDFMCEVAIPAKLCEVSLELAYEDAKHSDHPLQLQRLWRCLGNFEKSLQPCLKATL
jgi:hypothetical protein